MTKRYIISTNNLLGEDQARRFADYLTTGNFGWWHWLPNTWLVIDYKGNIKAADLAGKLRAIFPSAWFLVLEYKPTNDWMAYGPTGSGGDMDMIEWVRKNWVNPAESIPSFLS